MKIRTSLLLLLISGVGVIGAITLVGMNSVNESVGEIVNRENPKIEAALEMEININEMTKDLLEILERQDKIEEYKNNIQDFKDFSAKYKTLIRSDEEINASQKVDELFSEYEIVGDKLIKLHKEQLDNVIERRVLLNQEIEVRLDEELQPSQKISDPQYIEKILALEEMEINIHELISASRGYLLNDDQFLKERITDSIQDFRDAQSIFLSLDITSEETETMKKLGEQFNQVEFLTEHIINDEDEKITLLIKLDKGSSELDDTLDDTIQRIALEKIHEDERITTETIQALLIILPIVFVVIIFGAYIFSKKFSNITVELVRVTEEFKNGNLDARIKVSRKDEIGELGTAMNVMAERLQQASKEQGEFAAMVTHELKTPIVPIKGYAEMLETGALGDLNEDQKMGVAEIHKNAKQLEKLIQSVLNAQKLEVGGMKYDITTIDVDKYVSETIQTLSPYMDSKKIEFTNEVKAGLHMKGDTTKITEIFTNIVQNAVDFVPDEGGKINILCEETDTHVKFSIKDNGEGMSKKNQEKLFQKFYQVDTAHTRKHGGSGLGLAICKGYIDDMDGEIWLESDVGQGTTFFFTIPKTN